MELEMEKVQQSMLFSISIMARTKLHVMTQVHHKQILSSLVFPFTLPLKVFRMSLLGKGLNTLVKMFCSPPEPMWDLTIHPPLGPTSSLTLVSFSNRCGSPNSPLSQPSVLAGTPSHVCSPSGLSFLVGTSPGL